MAKTTKLPPVRPSKKGWTVFRNICIGVGALMVIAAIFAAASFWINWRSTVEAEKAKTELAIKEAEAKAAAANAEAEKAKAALKADSDFAQAKPGTNRTVTVDDGASGSSYKEFQMRLADGVVHETRGRSATATNTVVFVEVPSALVFVVNGPEIILGDIDQVTKRPIPPAVHFGADAMKYIEYDWVLVTNRSHRIVGPDPRMAKAVESRMLFALAPPDWSESDVLARKVKTPPVVKEENQAPEPAPEPPPVEPGFTSL